MGLPENLKLAQQANDYARSIIKNSTTWPSVRGEKLEELDKKLSSVRSDPLSNAVILKFLFVSENIDVIRIKNDKHHSKLSSIGNCDEFSFLVLNYLRKHAATTCEKVIIQDGDHSFVVIGRNPKSDINDYRTWGADAVVCDAWANKIYPASDLPIHLNCHIFDTNAQKHSLYAFRPGINFLKSELSLKNLSLQETSESELHPFADYLALERKKLLLLIDEFSYLYDNAERYAFDEKIITVKQYLDDLIEKIEVELKNLTTSVKENISEPSLGKLGRYFGKINRKYITQYLEVLPNFKADCASNSIQKLIGALTKEMNLHKLRSTPFEDAEDNCMLAINFLTRLEFNIEPVLSIHEIYLLACKHEELFRKLANSKIYDMLTKEQITGLSRRYHHLFGFFKDVAPASVSSDEALQPLPSSAQSQPPQKDSLPDRAVTVERFW